LHGLVVEGGKKGFHAHENCYFRAIRVGKSGGCAVWAGVGGREIA